MQAYQLQRLEKKYKGVHVKLFTGPNQYTEGIFMGCWKDSCFMMAFHKGRSKIQCFHNGEVLLIVPVKKYIPIAPNNIFSFFYSNAN